MQIDCNLLRQEKRLLIADIGQNFGLTVDDWFEDLPSYVSKRHIYGTYGRNKNLAEMCQGSLTYKSMFFKLVDQMSKA